MYTTTISASPTRIGLPLSILLGNTVIGRMGGSSIDDDWDLSSLSNRVSTIVLVGRTGNGKSATGNSILGRKAFISRASTSGVTSTCELQRTVLNDGHILNVIDTPGLFDTTMTSAVMCKSLVECFDLAMDGIHAILAVFSIRNRFSQEEVAAIRSLRNLFGENICDYMIIGFTGGDELEEDETLEDYLGWNCPESLKEVLSLCKNRVVLFNNKTKDENKRASQVEELISLVNLVTAKNDGRAYSNEIFFQLKESRIKMHEAIESVKGYSMKELFELEEMSESYEEQLNRISTMLESKLQETTIRLEKQLAEEHAARLEAQMRTEEAQSKSSDEIRNLRESLEKARQETDELRKKAESLKCAIL